MSRWGSFIKRVFDIVFASIGIFLTWWIMIIAIIVASIETKSFGLFIQKRVGKDAKLFYLFKIKSMKKVEGIDTTITASNDMRITKSGKFFRDNKIDELPQLFNVLKGDMSFVGPRPLLIEYLPLYNEEQKKRHNVKPGITGWAQVNGRNAISWEQKFEYDVWYVEHQSFLLDLKILWLTFLKVVKRSDISSSTSVTVEKFQGSK